AFALVADDSLGANQVIRKVMDWLLGRRAIRVGDFNKSMRAAFVIQVQILVVGHGVVFDPCAGRSLAEYFTARPPARQINLMDAAIDHHTTFVKSSFAARVEYSLAAFIHLESAVIVPDVNQAQRPEYSDGALINQ